MSIKIFCSLFDWIVCLILSCMSCLYILEINPLSVASFANIVSHSKEGCLFIFFMISFVVQKVLSLIKSLLLIFVFIFVILGGRVKKILWQFMSKSMLPIFSSESFIGSFLTFRYFICFEFTFVYGVRECSISFFYV